jgi:hypothetical protein
MIMRINSYSKNGHAINAGDTYRNGLMVKSMLEWNDKISVCYMIGNEAEMYTDLVDIFIEKYSIYFSTRVNYTEVPKEGGCGCGCGK